MDSRSYSSAVVTPEGTPLGGSVDLLVNRDGSYTAKFVMHSSSLAGSFDFRVMATLGAPGTPSLLFLHGGHVSGVNSDVHVENGRSDALVTYWDALMAAPEAFQVGKDYHWGGVVGTFNDLVKDVITLGGGALGATLGLVIGATREATDWMGLDLGPGGTLGVIAGLALFEVGLVEGLGSAGSFVVGTIGGVTTGAIANELIDWRPLHDAEKALARRVFANTVDLERVRVTNFAGIGGRPFTAPGVDGLIYCNLGAGYADPLGAKPTTYPAPGQLLVHELVHAWQICHSSSWPAMMCSGMANQTQYLFGDNVYAYGAPGADWGDFNAEQQASVVDQWFGGSENSAAYRPMSRTNPYYRYVVNDLRGGLSVPDLSVAAIQPRSDEGAVSLFTVADDGQVWTSFWPAPGAPVTSGHLHTLPGATVPSTWAPWFSVGSQTFPLGAPVTATHHTSTPGAVALFATDHTGTVWTNSWPAPNTEAGLASGHIAQWSGWSSLGPSIFAPAAPISAIRTRSEEGSTSLFGVGADGRVWSCYWPAANTEAGLASGRIGQWSDWFPLGADTFPSGAPVTAVRSRTDEGAVSLYVVGLDAHVWSCYWPAPGPALAARHAHRITGETELPGELAATGPPIWSPWFPIGSQRSRLASSVSALHARSDEGAVNLFVADADSPAQAHEVGWPADTGSRDWSPWRELAFTKLSPGTQVTAIHPRSEEGAATLFAVGRDGRVWSASGTVAGAGKAGRWDTWEPIGIATFPSSAAVAALRTVSDEGATALFAVGDNGMVWTTHWPAAPDKSEWASWSSVGDKVFPT